MIFKGTLWIILLQCFSPLIILLNLAFYVLESLKTD